MLRWSFAEHSHWVEAFNKHLPKMLLAIWTEVDDVFWWWWWWWWYCWYSGSTGLGNCFLSKTLLRISIKNPPFLSHVMFSVLANNCWGKTFARDRPNDRHRNRSDTLNSHDGDYQVTIDYRWTEDTGREVESSNWGSLLVKLIKEETALFVPLNETSMQLFLLY